MYLVSHSIWIFIRLSPYTGVRHTPEWENLSLRRTNVRIFFFVFPPRQSFSHVLLTPNIFPEKHLYCNLHTSANLQDSGNVWPVRIDDVESTVCNLLGFLEKFHLVKHFWTRGDWAAFQDTFDRSPPAVTWDRLHAVKCRGIHWSSQRRFAKISHLRGRLSQGNNLLSFS